MEISSFIMCSVKPVLSSFVHVLVRLHQERLGRCDIDDVPVRQGNIDKFIKEAQDVQHTNTESSTFA